MHFDDRLDTVLRLPVTSDALAAVQYRQLLDILGRGDGRTPDDTRNAALDRFSELSRRLPPSRRAAMLGEPSTRIENPEMLALLASHEPDVASAAIRSARLDEAQWLELVPALPVRARGILRHRRNLPEKVEALLDRLGILDRGLPPVGQSQFGDGETPAMPLPGRLEPLATGLATQDAPSKATPAPLPQPIPENVIALKPRQALDTDSRAAEPGIGDIVRRIEAFRALRGAKPQDAATSDDPQLPFEESKSRGSRIEGFDFSIDTRGRINWAEPHVAPMVVGAKMADQSAPDAETAFRHRLPIERTRITLSGAAAVAGEWQVDATPRFDLESGLFSGYDGRMRRPAACDGQKAGIAGMSSEADRMRQILHELRTPANGIQFSAEVIQTAYFGPVPHDYRSLAASIAGDIAQILAGFDELDRLVRLEGGMLALNGDEAELSAVLAQCTDRLRSWGDSRSSGFTIQGNDTPLPVALSPDDAESLLWRLLSALAGRTQPSEYLAVQCLAQPGAVTVDFQIPASLAWHGEDYDLFASHGEALDSNALFSGRFGLGFTLRLARAEARGAGGDLKRDGNSLRLTLPGLTPQAAVHSHG